MSEVRKEVRSSVSLGHDQQEVRTPSILTVSGAIDICPCLVTSLTYIAFFNKAFVTSGTNATSTPAKSQHVDSAQTTQ